MSGVTWTGRMCAITLLAATLSSTSGTSAQAPSFDHAAALQKQGAFEAAAAEYQRFLNAFPTNVEGRSNLGVVLLA